MNLKMWNIFPFFSSNIMNIPRIVCRPWWPLLSFAQILIFGNQSPFIHGFHDCFICKLKNNFHLNAPLQKHKMKNPHNLYLNFLSYCSVTYHQNKTWSWTEVERICMLCKGFCFDLCLLLFFRKRLFELFVSVTRLAMPIATGQDLQCTESYNTYPLQYQTVRRQAFLLETFVSSFFLQTFFSSSSYLTSSLKENTPKNPHLLEHFQSSLIMLNSQFAEKTWRTWGPISSSSKSCLIHIICLAAEASGRPITGDTKYVWKLMATRFC